MGQGVTVPNLAGNGLITGIGQAGDRLQSCSAVVMVNTVTGAAGLFHFPAGDINNDMASQARLIAMWTAVAPNWVRIAWGVVGMNRNDPFYIEPFARQQAAWIDALRDFLLGLVPAVGQVSLAPAQTGVAWVRLVGGVPQIGGTHQPPAPDFIGLLDLRNTPAGPHAGYTTYGP
jgi:hypothetical protein